MNGGVRIWELDHLRYMAESQGLLGLQPLQPLQPHTVTRTSVAAAAGAHSSSPQLTLPPTPEACVTAVVVADAQMPVGGLKAGAHHGEAGWLTEFIQVSLAICVYSVYTPPPHAHTHTSTHVRARAHTHTHTGAHTHTHTYTHRCMGMPGHLPAKAMCCLLHRSICLASRRPLVCCSRPRCCCCKPLPQQPRWTC